MALVKYAKTRIPSPSMLPCPFCGAEGHLYDFFHVRYHAECSNYARDNDGYMTCGYGLASTTAAGAAAKWNHRTPSPQGQVPESAIGNRQSAIGNRQSAISNSQ